MALHGFSQRNKGGDIVWGGAGKKICYRLLLSVVVFFLTTVCALAETEANDQTETGQKQTRKIGKWWLRNPLKFEPLIDTFLFHGEADFSFLHDTGNLDRNVKLFKGLIVVRKQRFSNYFSWDYQDRHAKRYGNELRDANIHEFHNSLRFALTKSVTARVGGILSSNEELGYDYRFTSYGGFGCRPVEKEMLILNVFLGGGYETQDYTDDIKRLDELAPQIYGDYASGGYHSTVAYGHETLQLYLSQTTGLEQTFEIIQYLEDSDTYRWTLRLAMQVAITKHITVVPSYTVSYNNNPLPWAEPQPWFTKKKDSSTNISIRFSI